MACQSLNAFSLFDIDFIDILCTHLLGEMLLKLVLICKDNKMKSPSLLSGPKIHKAYFEASNSKMLLQ